MPDRIETVTLSPTEQVREAAAQVADKECALWEGNPSVTAFSARGTSATIAAAIRALPLPPEPAMAVKVKPLEWEDWDGGMTVAATPWGKYNLNTDLRLSIPTGAYRRYETESAAKAAAQADYESRILAALDIATAPDTAKVAALQAENEQLRAQLDECAAKALEIAGKYGELVDLIVAQRAPGVVCVAQGDAT